MIKTYLFLDQVLVLLNTEAYLSCKYCGVLFFLVWFGWFVLKSSREKELKPKVEHPWCSVKFRFCLQ